MRQTMMWRGILLITGLGLFAGPALGLDVLLAPGLYEDIEVTTRLLELGHSVTEQDPATWDALYDYSAYDVVAFEFLANGPADLTHLVDAVDAGTVGVVIFRGDGSIGTVAEALGLISAPGLSFQAATQATILATPHPITQNHAPATYNLGYTNMSKVEHPGIDTTTLVSGPDGPALVVHNSRRAVVTPFYGHFAGYDAETAVGRNLTDNCLQWAAGQIVADHEASWGAVKSLYGN